MSPDDDLKKSFRRRDRIPAEQLTAYERWELPVMDETGKEKNKPAPEPVEEIEVKPFTAQDLEAIRQDAWNEGNQEGREEGFTTGHAEGFKKGHDEGYQQGFTQGRQDGEQQGMDAKRADIDTALKRLETVASDLMEPIRKHQDEVEQALLNLALAVSRSVIRRELLTDSHHIRGVIREALEALPRSSDQVRLHVNPQDAGMIREMAAQQQENWVIVEAPEVLPGGCKVETRHSLVNYTVEKRFQLAVQQMLDRHIAEQPADDSQDLTEMMGDMTDFHRELLETPAPPPVKPVAAPVSPPVSPSPIAPAPVSAPTSPKPVPTPEGQEPTVDSGRVDVPTENPSASPEEPDLESGHDPHPPA